MEDSKYDVTMELYARKLDKKDFFGKVRYPLSVSDLILWVGVCLVMWSLSFVGNNVCGCVMS